MTPKEKAEELIDKYVSLTDGWVYGIKNWEHKKQCALIAVDEVLNVLPQQEYLEDRGEYSENRERIYWKEVKQEIEKL
jgi:hypothetical protein